MKKSLIRSITIIPLALLLCFAFSCQQQVQEGITEEEAQALLDSALEIWNEGNMALIEDVFAPEIVARTSTFPDDIVGLEGIKGWVTFARTAYPDLHMTFDEVIVKGDKIVASFTFTGTNTGPLSMPAGELPPTGKKVRITGLGIDRVQNGKIVEELVVYNVLDMMLQLGFTLTPPQPSEPPEEKK
jgi:predicted ester cyclase